MNNKITFPRLATLLADKSGRSKRFSEDFLREFFALISEALEAQESVKIKGLGTFRLTRVEPRRSIDVTTGDPIEISGHTKIVFLPTKELAEAVNAPFEAFSAIEISDDVDIDLLLAQEDQESQNDNEDYTSDQNLEVAPTYTSPEIVSNSKETVISFDKTSTDMDLDEEDYDFSIAEEEISNEIEKSIAASPVAPSADNFIVEETKKINDISSEDKVTADTAGNFDMKETVEEKPAEPEERVDSEETVVVETHAAPEEKVDPEATVEAEALAESEGRFDQEETVSTETTEDTEENAIEDSEDFEEFETNESRKKSWTRWLLIGFGAAIIALFATFIIWYVFATNDFNSLFKRGGVTASADQIDGFVVGNKAADTPSAVVEPAVYIDTLADTIQDSETEEEVPTAPSDAIVYDTISTTRYLTTMAKKHYGNYNLWPYIYQENQSFLGHPDRIRPGTPVVIPKLSKYGVNPNNSEDIEKAKKLGVEIYARYGKKI